MSLLGEFQTDGGGWTGLLGLVAGDVEFDKLAPAGLCGVNGTCRGCICLDESLVCMSRVFGLCRVFSLRLNGLNGLNGPEWKCLDLPDKNWSPKSNIRCE